MTHATRLERWIAPRAMWILALASVFIVSSGVATLLLIRSHDLKRVSRLERVIRCQNNRECREFIERAVRDTLKDKGVKVDKKHGISLKIEEADGVPRGTIAIGPHLSWSSETSVGPSEGLGGPGDTQPPKKPPLPADESQPSPEGEPVLPPEDSSPPPGGRAIVTPEPPICVSVGELVETC